MNDTSAAPPLLRTTAEQVATLTLNRPRQYNALSAALLESLHAELDAIAQDPSVRVVLVTGAGQLVLLRPRPEGDARAEIATPKCEALFASCSAMMQKLVALPQPVIAVVNGLATAAGCQLVAQCDLAVASSNARFAASGINLGLFCSTPAVALSRKSRASAPPRCSSRANSSTPRRHSTGAW